ncbi:MAG: restriction endonuclease subunit S [Chlorobi bacterium]|nr:restriction endonuclease subunit S [Chlorobiota bacterium]
MNKQIANLLEQHFDTAFAAPDGIKKLRELILTLAMQSKLVEQDPNDPPASELLKEIEVDKKRQVKAGKIKKPKSLPAIDQSDAAYVLPQSWTWTRLGTIGNIFNGNSINAREKETKYAGANGLPYIATKDVGYGLDALDYKNGIYIPESEEKFKIAHQGAVLICAEGGSAGKKCGITEQDICFGNKLFANELFGGIPSKFILYLYLSPVFRESFSAAMTGIIGGVSIAKFVELPVPLPPLEEQHRIVARIDQLMARCEELEKLRSERDEKRQTVHAAAIKQLLDAPDGSAWGFIQQHFNELYSVKENVAELRKAILQLAVMGRLVPQNPNDSPASELLKEIEAEKQRLVKEGKIKKPKPLSPINAEEISYDLPKGWEWVRLGDIGVWKSGSTPSRTNSSFYGGDIPWVKSGEVKQGRIKTTEENITQAALDKCSLHINEKGSVLIAMYGANIGEAGILEIEAATNQAVCACKTYTYFDDNYLLYLITSLKPYFISQGAGAAQPNISREKIVETIFQLPPLPEQHRIVARINQLMALCDQLDQQINAANNKKTELLNALTAHL